MRIMCCSLLLIVSHYDGSHVRARFGRSALQALLLPYRYREDNIFFLATTMHLILTQMLVLGIKSIDEYGEIFSADDFDVVAVIWFVLLVPFVAVLCVYSKVYQYQQSARDTEVNTETERLQQVSSSISQPLKRYLLT